MKKKVYACWFQGREAEATFFTNWEKCSAYVKGLSGILYRGFPDRASAETFLSLPLTIDKNTNSNPSALSTSPASSMSDTSRLTPLHIYVDGSYLPTNDRAGWAWVAVQNIQDNLPNAGEKKEYIIGEGTGVSPDSAVSRNIDGEILATLKCLEWIIKYTTDNPNLNFKEIIIHHDYEGIAKWSLGVWKTNTPLTQNFRASMKSYINILKERGINLQFNKVLAHSGNHWNDYVDNHARKAIHRDNCNN